jgi:hypothetical protein
MVGIGLHILEWTDIESGVHVSQILLAGADG